MPVVPGDNSHYVEGQSQYIWMPDGEGNPTLVDLQEPADNELLKTRNGANNQYWLFSRYIRTLDKIKIVEIFLIGSKLTLCYYTQGQSHHP